MKKIDSFINSLIQEKNTQEYTNQYSNETENNHITTNNLKLYLEHIYKQKPEYLFVGEAPGYKGCRITGIPFTSEYILTHNFNNAIFGKENGYQIINNDKPNKEPTATIIWDTFIEKNIIPCFWNSFPFHPFNYGDFNSNRKPNKNELEIGKKYLEDLIKILKIKKENIIAIGDTSYSVILEFFSQCKKIRHPSNGGKQEFILGLENLFD